MSTQSIGNILLILAVIPAVASVVVFWPVVAWRSTWGSHLMAYMIALAVPLVLGSLRLVIGDSPGFQQLRTGAFGVLVAVLWWRLILLVRARFEPAESQDRTDREATAMAALISLMRLMACTCPECGEDLMVLMRADSVPGDNARLDIELDAKPVQDHIDKHLMRDAPKE